MTCIYDAWSEALRIGHDQIQLKERTDITADNVYEYVHVDRDNVKAEKESFCFAGIFPMKHIWMYIMQPFLQKKMRYRQFIIFCVSDSQWEVRYWNSISNPHVDAHVGTSAESR